MNLSGNLKIKLTLIVIVGIKAKKVFLSVSDSRYVHTVVFSVSVYRLIYRSSSDFIHWSQVSVCWIWTWKVTSDWSYQMNVDKCKVKYYVTQNGNTHLQVPKNCTSTWVNVLNSVFDELFLDGKEKSSIIEQNPVINIICSLLISYQSL